MDLTKTLEYYLNDLSSNSPTPGGGNVSALCGVLASSLGTMVCNLTIGKKKYEAAEKEMQETKKKLLLFREEFISLAKRDNEAFDKVMDAFKLPKENEEQKLLRRQAIEKATYDAAVVPGEVIKNCSELLLLLEIVSKKGNQNSLSDSGVAISLISAAAEGAFLNVLINCNSLSDKKTANDFITKYETLYSDVKGKCRMLISEIMLKMRNGLN
jgi:formiminotetrahydrofolate cyclodeaminase